MTGQALPLLEQYLPKSRVAHSLRVAETAKSLAENILRQAQTENIGGEIPQTDLPEKAYWAGLLHDIAKAMSPQKLCDVGIAQQPWYSTTYIRYPAVWHAFAGPRMIAHLFGPQEADVCSAIRYHTTGTRNMSTLDSILYIADYIEPGRPFTDRAAISDLFDHKKNTMAISYRDKLALAVAIIVTGSIIGLTKQQKAIHPLTLRCYNALSPGMTPDARHYWQSHITRYY